MGYMFIEFLIHTIHFWRYLPGPKKVYLLKVRKKNEGNVVSVNFDQQEETGKEFNFVKRWVLPDQMPEDGVVFFSLSGNQEEAEALQFFFFCANKWNHHGGDWHLAFTISASKKKKESSWNVNVRKKIKLFNYAQN